MEVTFVRAVATQRREFTCGSCGHQAPAVVQATGEARASRSGPAGVAEFRARKAAEREVDHTLSVTPCPKCGHRSGAAVAGWFARRVSIVLLAMGAGGAAAWLAMSLKMSSDGANPGDQTIVNGIVAAITIPLTVILLVVVVWLPWRRLGQAVSFEE